METKPEIILKELKNFEFHDLEVENLELVLGNEIQLRITLAIFDSKSEEFEKLTLEFSNVEELTSDSLILTKGLELELNRFEYKYDQNFNCQLIFLTGFGNPSIKIELICGQIKLSHRRKS